MDERELSDLKERVAYLEDRRAIEDLLTNYSRSLDFIDSDLLETVFFDDADIDYGFFKGTGKEFKPLLMDVERGFGRRFHFTAQIHVTLEGDVAYATSYNLSYAIEPVAGDPPADTTQFIGYYVDRCEKRNGRWGIASRKHLLIAGWQSTEVAIKGQLSALNAIGETREPHPDYRKG